MKIAFNQRVQEGPWGGGNNFAKLLRQRLIDQGHSVVTDLHDDDIDLILMIDPRRRNPTTTFLPSSIFRYLVMRNPEALVVHRINECDERKNTRFMNLRLRNANCVADHTVFIGSWLKHLKVWCEGHADADSRQSVILNGADPTVFHANGHKPWNGQEPLRLVTHHWGGNMMKGFDIYLMIDEMLGQPEWRDKIEFKYIGNLPEGVNFKHAQYSPPDSGETLAAQLRQNHVYVTGSINEPAGMHHIEGAMCGLPLLFRNSGALPEYCTGFGEMFDSPNDFEQALRRTIEHYLQHQDRMQSYPHTADVMIDNYIGLFSNLLENRMKVLAARRLWHAPFAHIFNHVII